MSLDGLFTIARKIDRPTQKQVLGGVMELARGQHTGEQLVSFDVDLGLATLALQCAAALNPDAAISREIEQIGLTHLRGADEGMQWQVTQALVLLPAESSRLDLENCAVHPWPAIRALAAIRWAKDPSVLPHERAVDLARDPEYRVRRVLAQALQSIEEPSTAETREIIAILSEDVRRSIRTLASQAEAHLRAI
jgi:hypothetical protein